MARRRGARLGGYAWGRHDRRRAVVAARHPYRAELVLIAFTVAIVTLLLQGGSLPLVIRLSRVGGTDEQAAMAELAGLVEEISTVGVAALDDPQLRTDGGEPFDTAVVDRVRTSSLIRVESAAERTDAGVGPHEQFRQLRRRVLDAERDALLDARATGSYSSEVLAKAQRMLDVEESRLDGAG